MHSMRTSRTLIALAALACAGLSGCKHDKPSAPAAKEADPASTGAIHGTVLLTGTPPAPVRIDTTMDPACGLNGDDTFSEQYAADHGKLANVYIYVKSGPPAISAYPDSGSSTILDQKGCRYTPHVIAVPAGGYVEFRNEDPTMHNIHTMPATGGNPAVDISQGPRGAPQIKQFKQPEVMLPVRCNNHPWMNAFINVSATPWFAVTGPDGSFDFKGMPPGDYVLAAVHEKLGEQTAHVTITPQGTAAAEFHFAMP